MAQGVLALIGSGETAPGMTKVHRELLSRQSPVKAVNLNSAYGFQLNVPQMSEKLEEYFDVSLQTKIETLNLTSYERASDVERSLFKKKVREANYVFAGPGSPSYALRQWAPLQLGDDLFHVLDKGATVCFASAAALTLGVATAPIYEIYKVGVEPYWLDGLDVLSHFGLNCVVIPHFDNQEGANYDTRYCYLGEPRLRQLEEMLPPGTATLGVDEHTALIFDFGDDTATVRGRSNAYWRTGSESRTLVNNSTVELSVLRNGKYSARDAPTFPEEQTDDVVELAKLVERGGDQAAQALATLTELARSGKKGLIDPTSIIEGILAARASAREAANFDMADRLRDVLVDSGVKVNDSVNGSTWSLD